MKKQLDAILVVEGKSDVAYLSSFIDARFVSTNGSDIPSETIAYLLEASKREKIIVLTDPDSPGKRIRDVLDSHIPNLVHCFVSKEKAIKKHKVGIAECDIEEIFKALDNQFVNKVNDIEYISINDMYSLNLLGNENSKQNRDKLSKKLSLGFNNGKSLYKKLNSLKLNKEDVKRLLNE